MSSHPDIALVQPGMSVPVIPPCVHYAGTEKLIRKSFALQDEKSFEFDVCCDLEDGAPRGQEDKQLEMMLQLLTERSRKKRVGVRINDYAGGSWIAELHALIPAAGKYLSFVTVPKIRSFEEIQQVAGLLSSLAREHKISSPPLHVLIETHGALRDIRRIAALREVQALEFGIMDFVSEHGGAIDASCIRSPGQFENRLIVAAKTEIAAAALSNGCVPVHNVTLELKDPVQVLDDAQRARRDFGFLRMWSIHPSQIEPICQALRPDFANIEAVAGLLVTAAAANWAPTEFQGRLVDRASYRMYWNLLQQAKLHGEKIPEAAAKLFFSK